MRKGVRENYGEAELLKIELTDVTYFYREFTEEEKGVILGVPASNNLDDLARFVQLCNLKTITIISIEIQGWMFAWR